MFKALPAVFFALVPVLPLAARERVRLPAELAAYELPPAPEPAGLRIDKGERIAICGDSITEQKRYSLILEAYLTACMPELETECRQFGWSGETAGGFLKRAGNDVLRFKPTLATTHYGMNDFRYVPFDREIAAEFHKNLTATANLFAQNGCDLIIGSPGIIDSVPKWVTHATGSPKDLNLALNKFRNMSMDIAAAGRSGFADIYQPMLLADHAAKQQFGDSFKVAGKDGVHPGWAGHLIMAHAFLDAMGVPGDLGTITWHDVRRSATATGGHEILSSRNGKLTIRSSKLPFSPGPGDPANDDSIRAGLALVPFDDRFNRLTLKVVLPRAPAYQVQWGPHARQYTAEQLTRGVSLAADFHDHPLVPTFQQVWNAIAAKQAYETRQIKSLVHGPEGKADLELTFALSEKTRALYLAAVKQAMRPVTHEILLKPLK
ncbi:MAG: SGNH/GDSL hydrolase family protein [Verrucomicrobiota bacterium JB025]|nr:SGNH/GDSL hydrolase family protein [Verrucomicrobiota bacterium JB025]